MKDEFEDYKKLILKHHDERLAQYDPGVKALSWGSEDSQRARFEVLIDVFRDFGNAHTVLDVGCGFGDLFHFITKETHIALDKYFGLDLNPAMIEEAKKSYPFADFEVRDILLDPPPVRFGYVVGSGLFFLRTKNWYQYVAAMVGRMYERADVGVAVNFLSAFSPEKKGKMSFYADPGAVVNTIAHLVSPKVVLRHDYKANDFTVFIYR